MQPRATRRGGVGRFFRSQRTGELAIVQWPNLPLGLYLLATVVRLVLDPDGGVGTAVSVVGGLALAWWALDEVVRGDSPFRRVLGAVVLATAVLGLVR